MTPDAVYRREEFKIPKSAFYAGFVIGRITVLYVQVVKTSLLNNILTYLEFKPNITVNFAV
jgi:hypothetical protein